MAWLAGIPRTDRLCPVRPRIASDRRPAAPARPRRASFCPRRSWSTTWPWRGCWAVAATRSSSSSRPPRDDEAAADRAWADLGLSARTAGGLPQHGRSVRTGQELAHRVVCGAGTPARRGAVGRRSWCSADPPSGTRARDRAAWPTIPRVVSLAEQPLSLGLSKACVRRAALLITTDSGPRHFAAAFRTPVITLFGPTHIAWTRTNHPQAIHLLPVRCRAGPVRGRSAPRVITGA